MQWVIHLLLNDVHNKINSVALNPKQKSIPRALYGFALVLLKVALIITGWIMRLVGLVLILCSDFIQKKVSINDKRNKSAL